jgi:hypothetical protein
MSRKLAFRIMALGLVLVLFVAFAQAAAAQPPAVSGTYYLTFYNYVSDEGGAACPGYAPIPGGTDGALNTFHSWPAYTSPLPGVGVDHYTACWDGWITFPQAGTWNVQTVNDDGIDVWVDGALAVQAWYDQVPALHQGAASVGAGAHHVIVKYYNDTLGGMACVGWGLGGQPIGYWACPGNPAAVYAPPVYYPSYPVPYSPQVYCPPGYVPSYGVSCAPVYSQPVYPPAVPYYRQFPFPPAVPHDRRFPFPRNRFPGPTR